MKWRACYECGPNSAGNTPHLKFRSIVRVWVAERELPCPMQVGIYLEETGSPEAEAWGTIWADVARHLVQTLESKKYGGRRRFHEQDRDGFVDDILKPRRLYLINS